MDTGLADANVTNRCAAVAAVGATGSARTLKLVEHALRDPSPLVRQAAAIELGDLRAPASIPALKAALRDRPEVAFGAARALWAMGDRSGRDILERVAAGKLKPAPGAFTAAMRDAQERIHDPARLLFFGMQQASGAFLGPAPMAFSTVRGLTRDKDATQRASAVADLASAPNPHDVELLKSALADHDWRVRAAAARALGERGHRGLLASLQPLLKDSRKSVRYTAAAAIIRLGGS